MDEIFLTEYEKEKMQEKLVNSAYSQGMREGIEQGENNKQLEIARKMVEKGMDEKDIFEIAGLSIEKIQSILETN